jgi:hypothetical protein
MEKPRSYTKTNPRIFLICMNQRSSAYNNIQTNMIFPNRVAILQKNDYHI